MRKQQWVVRVLGLLSVLGWPVGAIGHKQQQTPVACEPKPDGLRCTQGSCSDPESRCRPALASCDAAGNCRIVRCDCDGKNVCAVKLGEKGVGAKCTGKCGENQDCREVRAEGENGETLVSCECETRECEPRADGRACRRAACEGDKHKCKPLAVECDASGKCVVSECDCAEKAVCHVRLNEAGQPKCGGRCEAGNDCKERREELEGGGVRVTCDCQARQCEPRADGRKCRSAPCANEDERCQPTQVSCDADGRYLVVACDCQQRRSCRVRLPRENSNDEPSCIGACSAGTPCQAVREHQANGEILFTCKCDEQAKECGPSDNALACNGADCAVASERCRPTTVVCDASGACRVEGCDCGNGNACGIELGDNGQARCNGSCGFGGSCQLQRTPLDNGGVMLECGCAFAACGKPDSSGLRCTNQICSQAGHRCTSSSAQCDANGRCRVFECDCRDPSECRVQIEPSTRRASCEGDCPNNLECVESRTPLDGGGESVTCDCVEP